MIPTVITKNYAPLPINKREILRYAGVRSDVPEISSLLDDCISEAEHKYSGRVCYAEFPISFSDEAADLGFATVSSKTVRRSLEGCHRIILFAATVGLDADRLVARYSGLAPSKSLMLQAIGAERIESLCDAFCEDIKKDAEENGEFVRPRISPGYGDIPLSLQKDIFDTLDCRRRIGLSLNESLLMSPTKSVTAIVGIGQKAVLDIHNA